MSKQELNLASVVEDFALEPVSMEQRKPAYEIIVTLAGFIISPTAFLLGTVLGSSMGIGKAMIAILVGNLILAILGYYSGLIGQKTGLTTYMNSRLVFGEIGGSIPSLVIGITVMAIVGSLFGTVGEAVHGLIPGIPVWAAQVAFAIAIGLTSIFGFKGIAILSSVAVPGLIILGLIALYAILASANGINTLINHIPSETMSIGAGISAVIATWITGVSMVSDVGRYAKSKKHIAAATLVSWVVGAAIFEGVAVSSAIVTGSGNFVQSMAGLGLLVPAFIVFFVAMWSTADNNIWSFTLAFSTIGDIIGLRLSRAFWNVVAVAIALTFGLLGFAQKFGLILSAIAIFSPPIAGVMISHFFLLKNIEKLSERKEISVAKFRWQAFAAWIIGSIVALAFPQGVPALQGLIAAMVSYYLIIKVQENAGNKQISE